MRLKASLLSVALVLTVLLTAVPAVGQVASANAHGQCYADDDHTTGGEGEVSADSDGNVNALDEDEAVSIATALATFGQGQAEGGDGCENTDDDDPNTPGEEDEDHLSAEATVAGNSAGACYDNEGFHDTADCHDGSQGLP